MSPAPQPRPFFVEQTSTLSDPTAAPERVMHAAGHMLRRTEAAQNHGAPIDRALIDTALRRLARPDLLQGVCSEILSECESRVKRGAEEAFEVAFPQSEGETAMWRAAAFEALQMRDALASKFAALALWSELQGESDIVAQPIERLAALDATLRKLTPYFVSINQERRGALEGLDAGCREEAWWFGERADQDDLLEKLGALDRDSNANGNLDPKYRDVLMLSELPPLAGADGLLLRQELGLSTPSEREHLERLACRDPAWKSALEAAAAVDVERLPDDLD